MASLLSGFDEDKQRLSPHSNYGIPSSSGFGRLCFKNDCAKLQGKWGCWFWPSKMKVLSNNYHPDSIFGLFVGREMIIKNLSLTSRKKCIEKYNFEGDMILFTWRVCAKIRGPPVIINSHLLKLIHNFPIASGLFQSHRGKLIHQSPIASFIIVKTFKNCWWSNRVG